MRAKKNMIVLLIALVSLFPILSNVKAADNVTVNISMFGWEKQTRFDEPVIVAGIWNYINISKSNQDMDDFSFKLFKGYPAPDNSNRNEANYYEWRYNENNQTVWSDISGYGIEYINSEYCTKNDGVYSFCIGLKDTFPNVVDYCENWTIEVYEDGNKLYSENVVIEKPKTGHSLREPSSINFYVDPFTEMTVTGDPYFKIGNSGNIPLYININGTEYDNIEIAGLSDKFLPDVTRTLYVTLHSESWPPGIMRQDILLIGSCPEEYFLDTNATVTLYPSFEIIPKLQIRVGHSDYIIEEIEGTNIVFQHKEKLNMNEGEIKDINAYVSGDGPVTLEIWTDEENIRLLKLLDLNTETTSPITFTSSSLSERIITMTIEAISEDTTGVIYYKLTTNGVTKTYTTEITIGPPEPQKNNSLAISLQPVQIIVIILVLIVVIYMILSYFKRKRR